MKEMKLGEIPFYYNLQTDYHNPCGIPDKHGFIVCEDDIGVCIQKYSEITNNYLNEAYIKGSNISGLMDSDDIGGKYAQDFLKYILDVVDDVSGKNILEIGCGTGYLLHLLQIKGAIVEGIEPGQYARIGREKYSLNIVEGFFSAENYNKKFDIIIFYGVLEHISNYRKFLEDVKSILSDNGKIILSVPNCEPYIQSGDISMFLHEHWNYFTESTLQRVLNSLNIKCLLKKAGYGGAIYADCCVARGKLPVNCDVKHLDIDIFKKSINNVQKFFAVNKDKSIGVYCTVRIINYYNCISKEIKKSQIRFFDDDIRFHKLFFPGIDIQIENYMDLKEKPVDIMLIASLTFSKLIKDKVNEIGIKCITFKDILYEDCDNI